MLASINPPRAALKKGGWLEGSSRQRRTRCKHVPLDAHVALSWLVVLLFIFLSGNKLLVSAVVCGVRPLCFIGTIALFVSPYIFLFTRCACRASGWPLTSVFILSAPLSGDLPHCCVSSQTFHVFLNILLGREVLFYVAHETVQRLTFDKSKQTFMLYVWYSVKITTETGYFHMM